MIEQTLVHIRVGPAGNLPLYATAGSAGCDLFAAAALTLRPGESRILPLDLVMAIEPGVEAQIRPRSGLSLRTELRVPNAPGTIDSDYRAEVGVLLQNTFGQAGLAEQILANPQLVLDMAKKCRKVMLTEYLRQVGSDDAIAASDNLDSHFPELSGQLIYLDDLGNPWGTIYIKPGERIAQMIFSRCLQAQFIAHPDPESIGLDRGGGFGSTGLSAAPRGDSRT